MACLFADGIGLRERDTCVTLKRLPLGGAAVSDALIAGFAAFGIEVTHCWGMTEISPLGLVNVPRSTHDAAEAARVRSAQGLPIPGCAMRIVGEDGTEGARDGRASGELQVRSPWAASGYFDRRQFGNRAPGSQAFAQDERGRTWLRTGDVATIDPHGYVRIVDRTKDLIKSGGEWISSIDLEELLMRHDVVREAAVVSRPDPVYQERPVAFVTLRPSAPPGDIPAILRDHLAAKLAKWQIPDAFVILDELPRGSTGKIDKGQLRRRAGS